jgi:hypothetical protein
MLFGLGTVMVLRNPDSVWHGFKQLRLARCISSVPFVCHGHRNAERRTTGLYDIVDTPISHESKIALAVVITASWPSYVSRCGENVVPSGMVILSTKRASGNPGMAFSEFAQTCMRVRVFLRDANSLNTSLYSGFAGSRLFTRALETSNVGRVFGVT